MGSCSPDSARFVSIHDNPARYARRFQKDQSVIARHIANVFKEGELDRDSNMQILHNTISKYKPTAIYNLEVIISTRLVMNFLV